MGELTDQEICQNLKELYDESENRVKNDAMVNRAFIDKTSTETINQKVNAQINSIKAEIFKINPKFKEGSKNYDQTKKLVAEALANYEKVLMDLCDFYDGKIEQLILRKVELEASLVGTIVTEEYLKEKGVRKALQKENDQVKQSVKDSIQNSLNKILGKAEDKKPVNPQDIAKLMDQQDIYNELDEKLEGRIEKTENDKKENKENLEKIEKEIRLIDQEITRLNEQKKKSILDAMEVGEKTLIVNIRRPRVFKSITRFFASRFNTAKVVETTVITPLNARIEAFKENELVDIKGE